MINIPIFLNNELIKTLQHNNIQAEDYKPAYDGESVALDLYTTSEESIIIPANKSILIPTGLHIALPRDYAAVIMERGSIIKTPLIRRAGVIDPGFTNQIFVSLLNTSNNDWIINARSKLPVQLLVYKITTSFIQLSRTAYEEITSDTNRGVGMVGSSD
jgi:dUTP pyrophosphatase